jgi:hypothetical protein
MDYLHRVLIGMTGAIGKMGPQSQIITNRVGFQIGQEIGAELKQRKLIAEGMAVRDIWVVLNRELQIDSNAVFEESGEAKDRLLKITIKSCNICPKKVGKYAIPGTACPVGGLLKGAGAVIGLMDFSTFPDLVPGETCSISVPLDAATDAGASEA